MKGRRNSQNTRCCSELYFSLKIPQLPVSKHEQEKIRAVGTSPFRPLFILNLTPWLLDDAVKGADDGLSNEKAHVPVPHVRPKLQTA